MPLKMRGNAAISRECWEMCPHTSARLSAPAANRLKYSERRKGLCARSSAVSASNQPSVVMPRPPFRRPDYIERAPSQAAGSRDARGRPPVTGGVLERSEEHTSELQSHSDLVCRLLLEKTKPDNTQTDEA